MRPTAVAAATIAPRRIDRTDRQGGVRMRRSLVMLAMLGVAAGSDEALEPWGTRSHPTDAARRHVEEVAAGRHVYVVRQGGTMDGTNCRSPLGVGMADGPPVEQTW